MIQWQHSDIPFGQWDPERFLTQIVAIRRDITANRLRSLSCWLFWIWRVNLKLRLCRSQSAIVEVTLAPLAPLRPRQAYISMLLWNQVTLV